MMLLNAFSLNMLAAPASVIATRPASLDEAREAAAESAVGHASTAAVFAAELGVPVECERRTVTLGPGDTAIVGQYRGPRLPEGATSLPEGAESEWVRVEVIDVKELCERQALAEQREAQEYACAPIAATPAGYIAQRIGFGAAYAAQSPRECTCGSGLPSPGVDGGCQLGNPECG